MSYAPPGAVLICVSILEDQMEADEARLQAAVREQLSGWFGPIVQGWRHLRTYRIAAALPEQQKVELAARRSLVQVRSGIYACGDYLDTASINGALRAGRLAAETLIADFTQERTRVAAA